MAIIGGSALIFATFIVLVARAAHNENVADLGRLAEKTVLGLNRIRNSYTLSKLVRTTSIRTENSSRGTLVNLDAYIAKTTCNVAQMNQPDFDLQQCALSDSKMAEFCELKAMALDKIVVIEKANCSHVPIAVALGQ